MKQIAVIFVVLGGIIALFATLLLEIIAFVGDCLRWVARVTLPFCYSLLQSMSQVFSYSQKQQQIKKDIAVHEKNFENINWNSIKRGETIEFQINQN